MSSGTPPKKNTIYTFDVALRSATDSVSLQDTPTLAAGDVQVSTDNGAFANLGTLPAVSPAGGIQVKVTLSATEMNGDDIGIAFVDQTSPKEWCDLFVYIKTSTRQIDDLAYPTVSGRSLDVSATGEAGIDWANIGSPTTAQNLSATNIDTDQVVASVTGAVGSVTGAVGSVTGLTAATVHADLDDIQARLPAALTADGNIKADTLRVGGTLQTAGDIIGDTDDIQTRLPAALVSGRMDSSVGAMAAAVVTAAAIATDAIDADAIAANAVTEIQSGLSTLTASQVNAEVVDALNVDTYAEPGQGAPAATATLAAKINYLFKAWRNRTTQTAAQYSLYNDDAVTIDQKRAVSDDAITFDRAEVVTGP